MPIPSHAIWLVLPPPPFTSPPYLYAPSTSPSLSVLSSPSLSSSPLPSLPLNPPSLSFSSGPHRLKSIPLPIPSPPHSPSPLLRYLPLPLPPSPPSLLPRWTSSPSRLPLGVEYVLHVHFFPNKFIGLDSLNRNSWGWICAADNAVCLTVGRRSGSVWVIVALSLSHPLRLVKGLGWA